MTMNAYSYILWKKIRTLESNCFFYNQSDGKWCYSHRSRRCFPPSCKLRNLTLCDYKELLLKWKMIKISITLFFSDPCCWLCYIILSSDEAAKWAAFRRSPIGPQSLVWREVSCGQISWRLSSRCGQVWRMCSRWFVDISPGSLHWLSVWHAKFSCICLRGWGSALETHVVRSRDLQNGGKHYLLPRPYRHFLSSWF